jgi:hypothetical protein
MGQDLSKYGQRYSHMGLAYREGNTWRVAHKLNQCGTAEASVYRQGLGEFFLDDLFDYQAGVMVLAPDVQARLLPALRDNRQLAQLNTRAYSMVAYPWAQTYQQSNQWALETLAMTQDPAATNVAFDDHPNEKRFTDRIETVTVDSAFAWLQRSGIGTTQLAIR